MKSRSGDIGDDQLASGDDTVKDPFWAGWNRHQSSSFALGFRSLVEGSVLHKASERPRSNLGEDSLSITHMVITLFYE